MMQFFKMLKARRKQLDITQKELADKLYVTRQAVSRWENNLGYPNLDVLIRISEILELSLDELLKGKEEVDVVNKISKDVRSKKMYKRISIIVSTILAAIVAFLFLFGYGRYTQNNMIDRFNPFLATKYGYGVLPEKYKVSKVDTFISDNPFGDGEWLRFETGQYAKQDKWVVVAHKGSYVSSVRNISDKEIPPTLRTQVGTEYFKYNKKAMGPRISKKLNWLPFNS